MSFYYKQFFSYEKVNELLNKGFAIDAREGGLVLGRSHDKGGVYFLSDFGTGYKLMGELEGYEYVLSLGAHVVIKSDFDKINNHIRDEVEPFQEYTPDPTIKIVDTFLPPGLEFEAKLILFEGLTGGQPIINKHSAKKFLQNIDQINQRYITEYNSKSYFERTTIKVRDTISGAIIDERPLIWKNP